MLKTNQIQKIHKILIVDDQEINRDILGSILEDRYQLAFASNGIEALEYIKANYESLSLVMLDLIMPEMDGFEVLQKMQEDEDLKNIPVIVFTSANDAELKALNMGAVDFITKPFDVHEVILARASRIIELNEGRQLISAAERDRLTKLYTRNFFYEYANRLYSYHSDKHLDAVSLNIEQFHTINAVNGRDFGDNILRVLGSIIRTYLCETTGIAGRFEADNFIIYCEQCENYSSLLTHFQNDLNAAFPNISVHLRMGVMMWQEGVSPVAMFDYANTACNKVRGDYSNPLMIFNEEMRQKDIFERTLLNDLKTAIDEEQLVVYYQPKYDIQSNPPRLISAEALIRWNHPELGLISPGAFVPLFEGNGLISIVDNFVWQKAAKQVAQWKEKFKFSLPISVNVSRTDVVESALAQKLSNLVKENNLDYSELKLEITESAYTQDSDKIITFINEIKKLGFEIEMDDFGSGYSSLNMLSSMPIDVLKMDMKFIRNIELSETDRRLVALVIEIAKQLNLTVVAEGVENEEQLEILQKSGCYLVQGYYFSRPVPAKEFEKLIIKELATERN